MTYRLRNILIAVALAIVAALITAYYVSNVKKDAKASEALVAVYVAGKDIVAGTPGSDVVSGGYLETKEVAKRTVVPGAISNPAQVEDLVASETIYAGEQVTARRFEAASQQGIVSKISGNMRAFEVPGDQFQLLAGTLKTGDRVDVVASIKFKVRELSSPDTTERSSGGDVERTASRVVLRDLEVLRAPDKPALDSGIAKSVGDELSVVLAVTDSQAQKLFYVLRNGDWSLELRPATDPLDSPESVETVESVLGDGLQPAQLNQLINGFGRSADDEG